MTLRSWFLLFILQQGALPDPDRCPEEQGGQALSGEDKPAL